MKPRPGHNGGPALDPGRDREKQMRQLHEQIAALRTSAEAEATAALHDFEARNGLARFFPSRLAKCPRDRLRHEAVRASCLAAAIAKRQGQMDRLARKLTRLMGKVKP